MGQFSDWLKNETRICNKGFSAKTRGDGGGISKVPLLNPNSMDISMAVTMDNSAVEKRKRKKPERRKERRERDCPFSKPLYQTSIFHSKCLAPSTCGCESSWWTILHVHTFIHRGETRALGTVTCCAAAITGAKRTSAILFTCVLYPYPCLYLERPMPLVTHYPSPITLPSRCC